MIMIVKTPESQMGSPAVAEEGVFTIIIIFFPHWWLSYYKLFYLSFKSVY